MTESHLIIVYINIPHTKLKQLGIGGWRYGPELAIYRNGDGSLWLTDFPHVRLNCIVDTDIYDTIMESTSLDHELYNTLIRVGLGIKAALMVSLS